ncbi:hypothetical protein BT96DRAFT_986117 [Gymnopus androsaceus JB14]|uniref:Uncharacterized protein n=1 Tax=Gymnopus androsaceus JB14 TaxID=1447944 RepID=A0A6A4IF27_9AGAR|nr:hypothetical protein BT96DRAFT_986117 [Gymnopus androsaceus JB14]
MSFRKESSSVSGSKSLNPSKRHSQITTVTARTQDFLIGPFSGVMGLAIESILNANDSVRFWQVSVNAGDLNEPLTLNGRFLDPPNIAVGALGPCQPPQQISLQAKARNLGYDEQTTIPDQECLLDMNLTEDQGREWITSRPFGVASLIAGIDELGPQLSIWTFVRYQAKVIGSGSEVAQAELQDKWHPVRPSTSPPLLRVIAFSQKTPFLEQIVIFRDGVSEGEFECVRLKKLEPLVLESLLSVNDAFLAGISECGISERLEPLVGAG